MSSDETPVGSKQIDDPGPGQRVALVGPARDRMAARDRINQAFVVEQSLGDPLPDQWDETAFYADGRLENEIVLSLRIVPPTPGGLPMERYVDLDALGIGHPRGEATHLVILPRFRGTMPVLDCQGVFREARTLGCRHLVVEALPGLERFYTRLGLTRIGPAFHDPTIKSASDGDKPNAIVMHVDVSVPTGLAGPEARAERCEAMIGHPG